MTDEANIIVQVRHSYAQSPEKVFDAWLDPSMVRRFMFAKETGELVRCEIDPRVRGKFVMTDRRDGEDVEHTGEYLEIDRPRRLRFTFGIPAFSTDVDIVTIEIAPVGAGCELTLTAEMKPAWAQYADSSRKAWGRMLQSLAGALD